jgi:hypothetical protein
VIVRARHSNNVLSRSKFPHFSSFSSRLSILYLSGFFLSPEPDSDKSHVLDCQHDSVSIKNSGTFVSYRPVLCLFLFSLSSRLPILSPAAPDPDKMAG